MLISFAKSVFVVLLQQRSVLLLFLCSIPIAQAQTKPSKATDHGSVQGAERQMDELRKQIASLQAEIEKLKTTIAMDEMFLKNKQERSDAIILDLTQKTYQRLDTDTGFFLISVEDAVPYLNGYKIHLSIGNPSSATYTNYKLKIRYNRSFDWQHYTDASYKDWNNSTQEKEISYPESLQPGTWNSVDIILAPASSDQLGYFVLSMTTNSVSLHTR